MTKLATILKPGRNKVKIPKTRRCRDCNKRKPTADFYKQNPYRAPQFKPDYRWECKKCHHIKSVAAYCRRTTKQERAEWRRNYMKQYRIAT